MARKQYFAIIGTTITKQGTVADFSIIICDRNGRIFNQCAVLVNGHFDNFDMLDNDDIDDTLIRQGKRLSINEYNEMLNKGRRMLVSIRAINSWIAQVYGKYTPTLIGYNLQSHLESCEKTGIDLSLLSDGFCLKKAISNNICNTNKYRDYLTKKLDASTNQSDSDMRSESDLERILEFVTGKKVESQRSSLENIRDAQIPLLCEILKKKGWKNEVAISSKAIIN